MGIISSDKVGPSVAHDIKVNSVIAVLFSLLAIALYIIIRFKRWQWGVGSVISLALDALFTIGLFSLLHGILPFSLEVDQSFIAAILTIIGYSINDKVVIFDRIREYQTLSETQYPGEYQQRDQLHLVPYDQHLGHDVGRTAGDLPVRRRGDPRFRVRAAVRRADQYLLDGIHGYSDRLRSDPQGPEAGLALRVRETNETAAVFAAAVLFFLLSLLPIWASDF